MKVKTDATKLSFMQILLGVEAAAQPLAILRQPASQASMRTSERTFITVKCALDSSTDLAGASAVAHGLGHTDRLSTQRN